VTGDFLKKKFAYGGKILKDFCLRRAILGKKLRLRRQFLKIFSPAAGDFLKKNSPVAGDLKNNSPAAGNF